MGGQHNALVLLEEQGVGTFQLRRGIEVRASINFEDFLLEKIQIFGKSSLFSQRFNITVIQLSFLTFEPTMQKTNLLLLLCIRTWSLSSSFSVSPRAVVHSCSYPSRNIKCPIQNKSPIENPRSTVTSLNYGDVRGVDAQLVVDTWQWCSNLGAPAALVAGAVLATMVDSRKDLAIKKGDGTFLRLAKKATRILLLTSFGLEIVSIFVTTVTGTMILSHGDMSGTLANFNFNSPLGFMMNNWEFEYLTSRICFLQGLFHWLASVALEQLIPKEGEGLAARRMNQFIFSALMTTLIFMLSFLNRHIKFYDNYFFMWKQFLLLTVETFFWPLKPLTILLVPMMLSTTYFAYRALRSPSEEENTAYETNRASDASAPE